MATLFDNLPTAFKKAFAAFYDDLVGQGLALTPPAALPAPPNLALLPFAASVSAAIAVKDSPQLLRTLTSSDARAANASLLSTWDSKNDDGAVVSLDRSQLELRVTYKPANSNPTWELLCNTSDSWTAYPYVSLLTMSDLAISPSGETYAALGYNEQQAGLVASPAGTQAPRPVLPGDLRDNFMLARTDATYVYAVSNGGDFDDYEASYVARFRQDTKAYAPFSSGASVTYGGADVGTVTKNGVLSPRASASPVVYSGTGDAKRAAWVANRITGLAVNGSYIAVARRAQNAVQFYQVGTGAAQGTLSVSAPGAIAFTAAGDLLVITGTSVVRYGIGSGAASFSQKNTLPGLVAPLSLDCHATQDIVLVADGGGSQQLKAYTAAGGNLWTYGQAGGYQTNGPAVSYDKLWFTINDPLSMTNPTDRDPFGAAFTFVKFAPDGSFWVLDTCNLRALHFSAARAYLGQISYLPDRLQLAGDQADPTRLFVGMLEYQVSLDTAKPGDQSLSATPSWKLVKNWSAGLDFTRYTWMVNVLTHKPSQVSGGNGRTYAQVRDNSTNAGQPRTALVELPATGNLRFTGQLIEDYGNGGQNVEQMEGGQLRVMRGNYDAWDAKTGPAVFWAEEKRVTGYDANGNPTYGAVQRLWTVNSSFIGGSDPYPFKGFGGRMRTPKLANNTYLTYQPQQNEGVPEGAYHLGLVQGTGSTTPGTWAAKFYRGTSAAKGAGKGDYPEIPAYGGIAGANAYADGQDIVVLYGGQNNDRSNTFSHFRNGQHLRDFGVPATPYGPGNVPAGLAGNPLDMYMIRVSSTLLHVYCGDESAHAGLHRWRVPTTATTLTFPIASALPS
jgi:hypothetical protein